MRMFERARKLISWVALGGVGLAVCLLVRYPTVAADAKPGALESRVVALSDAASHTADWGEMRRYFTGETFATKDVLVAVAIVEPDKAVHRAHRHPHEEYLLLVRGSGTWSLDGKESEANAGDILYVEPWVYHGLTNTGQEKLIFAVIRYNGKGVDVPPRPDDRPDEL
ncbi:MAG: cupin domain-containing protein [Planctomycetota bacterium]